MSEARFPRPPRALVAACVVLGVEVLGLLTAAIVIIAKTVTGTPGNLGRALLAAGFALAAAVVLALCARGLARLRPAARTPVVVLQLLALPVAYSLAFEADRVEYGGPILLLALAELYLLFVPPVRAVLDRSDLPTRQR